MILMDAGPMVALLRRDDQHHSACREALREITEPLTTAWPAVVEAMYLLAEPRAQAELWKQLEAQAPRILPLDYPDLAPIRRIMERYADRGIDLADAALVWLAEREGTSTVFTVDRRDFQVYRIGSRQRFRIIP